MKHEPKKHTIFLVFNTLIIFFLLGAWLIYRMLVDNYALAGF